MTLAGCFDIFLGCLHFVFIEQQHGHKSGGMRIVQLLPR